MALVGDGLPAAEVQELLRQIKQERPEMRCLVLTVRTQQRRLALAAGADDVLPSGVPAGEMLSAIQKLLEDYLS